MLVANHALLVRAAETMKQVRTALAEDRIW